MKFIRCALLLSQAVAVAAVKVGGTRQRPDSRLRREASHSYQAQAHPDDAMVLPGNNHHQSDQAHRGTATKAICTQDQNRPGCQGNPECEALICANEAYCCTTEWDSLCAEEAANFYECACPRPTLQIVAPDPLFPDLYFVCDYQNESIDYVSLSRTVPEV